MTDKMQGTLNMVRVICEATDRTLVQYDASVGNIEIPTLMKLIATNEGWDKKTTSANDAIVRFYLRNHPDWTITKGARGGVIPRAVWEQKQDVKNAKALAKQQMQAKLDAMVASNAAQKVPGNTYTSTDEEFEETCMIVRDANATDNVMQQVAEQDVVIDKRHATTDEGRKVLLDTMVQFGQKMLDEQDSSGEPTSEEQENVSDIFADIDDDLLDEENDELSDEL